MANTDQLITKIVDSDTPSRAASVVAEGANNALVTRSDSITSTNIYTGNDEVRVYSENHICTDNTSATPLGAGATFTGDWQDCLNYQEVNVSVDSDQDSAANGLVIQWSADGVTVADTDSFNVYANKGTNYTPNPAFRYVRVVYTNGSTPQTRFSIMTILRRGVTGGSFHRIDSTLRDDSDGRLGLSVLKLRTAQDNYVSGTATNGGNFKVAIQEYGDTPSIDSFDRLRVSEPYTVFDSKQLHDKQPLFWDETTGGSATSVHSSTDARTRMTVTANANDYVIRQTKQRFNYQPGKGQLILMTFYAPQVTGITNRIGEFDGVGTNNLTPNNGIFFECNNTLSWNIAKDGSVTETATQANWNVDPLDGTGPSGATLDMAATQIAIIDFEWLGVGRVRVGFVIDGIIRYCHYFNHANYDTFKSVYMSTPNLPLRYSIQTDGTNGSTLDHICSSVMSEGGLEKTGVLRVVNNGSTAVICSSIGTTYALLGIRLKSAYSDITILPESVSMVCTSNDAFKWSLRINPTVAGTFTYSDVTNSAIQRAIGVTANTVTGGIEIAGGYSSVTTRESSEALKTALTLGSTIAGVMDTMVLCITPLTSNASMLGALNFRELL